jgi:hypothetical protein
MFLLDPVLSSLSASAQTAFVSGTYEIISGTYSECCGFAGEISRSLPDESQSFVKLVIDSDSDLASMTFLGQDTQTVFRVYPCPPIPPIDFSFDYGFVSADQIFFHVDPGPDQKFWSYTITNAGNQLWIDGTVGISDGGCADVPNRFTHSSVVASRLTNGPVVIDQLRRDANSMRFHFVGDPPYDYTVEYSDSLSGTNWMQLATYRVKLEPMDISVTNSFSNAVTRLFRVRQTPCECR